MRETRQSGSEGGANENVPTPISAQGFNPGYLFQKDAP